MRPEPSARDGRWIRPAAAVLAGAVLVGVLGLALVGPRLDGSPAVTLPAGAAALASPWPDLTLLPVASPSPGPPSPASIASASPSPPSSAPTASPAVGIRADRIRIARLDIDLPVIQGDGLDAPLGKAAHHPDTAWPGAGSNVYIYAHARTGMFLALWHARTGDVVELHLVDGTTRRYVVERVLAKVPWDAVEYLAPTPTEQLTLQTSTSYYATAPRFVVIARPEG